MFCLFTAFSINRIHIQDLITLHSLIKKIFVLNTVEINTKINSQNFPHMSDQIEQLRAKYEYIYIVREQNKKQAIFRVPKHVFIKNVLIYLEDGDLMKLSITCKFFSLMIFNPFTLRILLAVRGISKIPQTNALLAQAANQDSKLEDKKIHSSNNEDIMAQLETLKMVKEFMTDKVRGLEDSIKTHQKDLNQLKKDLFYERSQNITTTEKIQVLENKVQAFDIDKQTHGDTVKELNLHYQKIVDFSE